MWQPEKEVFSQSLQQLQAQTMIVVCSFSGPISIKQIFAGGMNEFIRTNLETTVLKPSPVFDFPSQAQPMMDYIKQYCQKPSLHDNWVFILATDLKNKQEIARVLQNKIDDSFHTQITFALEGSKTMQAYNYNRALGNDACISNQQRAPKNNY